MEIWLLMRIDDECTTEGIFPSQKALEEYLSTAHPHPYYGLEWQLWNLEVDNLNCVRRGSVLTKTAFDKLDGVN